MKDGLDELVAVEIRAMEALSKRLGSDGDKRSPYTNAKAIGRLAGRVFAAREQIEEVIAPSA